MRNNNNSTNGTADKTIIGFSAGLSIHRKPSPEKSKDIKRVVIDYRVSGLRKSTSKPVTRTGLPVTRTPAALPETLRASHEPGTRDTGEDTRRSGFIPVAVAGFMKNVHITGIPARVTGTNAHIMRNNIHLTDILPLCRASVLM